MDGSLVGLPLFASLLQLRRRRLRARSIPSPHARTSSLTPPTTTTAVKASKEEMDKNQVDLALRDACAHLLIPLNK